MGSPIPVNQQVAPQRYEFRARRELQRGVLIVGPHRTQEKDAERHTFVRPTVGTDGQRLGKSRHGSTAVGSPSPTPSSAFSGLHGLQGCGGPGDFRRPGMAHVSPLGRGHAQAADACRLIGCRCGGAFMGNRCKKLMGRSAGGHSSRRRRWVRSAAAEARRWWSGRGPRFLNKIRTRGDNSAKGPGRSGCKPTRRPASDLVRLRCVLEVPSRAGCLASTCPVRRPGNLSPRERPRGGPRVSEKYTISRKFMQMGRYGQIPSLRLRYCTL